MLNLNTFNKALKLSWVRKYLDSENNGKWSLLFDSELQEFGGVDFFKSNLNRKDLFNNINVADTFTAELIQIWSEISFDGSLKSMGHFRSLGQLSS